MELYFITRGIKHDVDRFVNDLQSQYFQMEVKGKKYWVQGGLRPIQLWTYVFPKEDKQIVINTLKPQQDSHGISIQTQLAMLRKMLKAKKIPAIEEKGKERVIYHDNVQVVGIGIRDDKIENDVEML